jgi:tetratricopeptide (TPR) repeat protein
VPEPDRNERLAALLGSVSIFLIVGFVALRTCVSSWGVTMDGAYPSTHSTNFFAASLILVGVAIALAARLIEGGMSVRAGAVEAAVFAMLAACALSIRSSVYILASIEFSLGWAACLLAFYAGAWLLGRPFGGWTVSIFLSLASVIALYGLAQRFFFLGPLLDDPASAALRATPDGLERLRQMQPFSVFGYPNHLAIFCVFTTLVCAGSLWDARRAELRGHLIFKGPLIAASLLCVYLASAKGAWVALGAGLSLLIFRILHSSRRRWAWVWLGLAAAGGIGVAAAASSSDSMTLRFDYWKAAWGVVRAAPATGIGLLNYQDYHGAHKAEGAPDVKFAHNDYLQILAELGALGLAAFAGFGALLLRGLWSENVSPPSPRAGGTWTPGLGAALGIAMAWVLHRQFATSRTSAPAAIALVVLLLLLYWRRPVEERLLERPIGFRWGVGAGLAALLAHMVVDFDFYEHALWAPVLLLTGAALAMGTGGREVVLDRIVLGIIGGFILVVAAVGGLYPSSRLLASDARKLQAQARLDRFDSDRNDEGLREAIALLEEAARSQRWDPDLYFRLSQAYRLQAGAMAPEDDAALRRALEFKPDTKDEQIQRAAAKLALYRSAMERSLDHGESARLLRPRNEKYVLRLSETLVSWGDFLTRVSTIQSDPSDRIRRQAEGHYQLAIQRARQGVDLAPDLPHAHFFLGQALRRMGRSSEAAASFRRALDLHSRSRPDAQKLSSTQVAEAEDLIRRE